MDIGTLQSQLATLGVSLVFDDDASLPGYTAQLQTELQTQRQYRAALYVDHLVDTRTFLTTTLAGATPGGLGPGYPFVQQALAQGSLLNGLAASLDEWLCPAVEDAINAAMAVGPPNAPTTYQGWFDTDVFDPDDTTYTANVAEFFTRYPFTHQALTQIAQNFRNNIATACQRIIDDRRAITALFSDRYDGLTLSALSDLSSTGSDFHKGGQQVLVLTFTAQSFLRYARTTSTLKLIYKPADLEVDCLITGESAAVNRATGNPDFLQHSLVEIFNAQVAADPTSGARQLPTYRILPRNPTSGSTATPVPVRNAYGYIEFLGYSLTGMTWGVFNFYPLGASDYAILRGQNEALIIETFYRQAGQLLALAVTFSITDLHIENVLVTGYQPHLIDLEVSLTEAVTQIAGTQLFFNNLGDRIGGIDGEKRLTGAFVHVFKPVNRKPPQPPQVLLSNTYFPKWYQNRLYTMHPARKIVPVNESWLLQGLEQGMGVLQAVQRAGGFADWFGRCTNVLVRVLPLATQDWNYVRGKIYNQPEQTTDLATAVNAVMLGKLTDQFTEYQQNLQNRQNQQDPAPEPDFLAAAAPQATTDLKNFDIPVFYHRIGTSDLLDSTGTVVQVPVRVTVLNDDNPPTSVQADTNVGRTTYYVEPPTPQRVQKGKVAALTAAGFGDTVGGYKQQVLTKEGLAKVPANPGVQV
ncbi:DUF4135 domain-containing protein [Streptomyces sp. NPDC005279]|uniref:DUF4135 domain-containing protein n=1 Tax=Streptomyces sp. NPDC005279 TaxID=3364712 RepID=UPI0036C5E6DF